MDIIGQESIIQFIHSNTLSTFPHTVLLEGSFGSGRHTICQYIGKTYGLEVEDISDNLNYEYIENIMMRSNPWLYIIDSSKITVKNENAILKFLEEPMKNSFIVLLCENKHHLLDTIRNRCYCITMQKYTTEQLHQFISVNQNEAEVLSLCETPGEILNLQSISVLELFDLCHKIFDKISSATFANTLTLSNNLAFKDEKDKYNVALFFRALLRVAYSRAFENRPNSIGDYMITRDYIERLLVKNIDKKYLFENYLITLKKSRCGQ